MRFTWVRVSDVMRFAWVRVSDGMRFAWVRVSDGMRFAWVRVSDGMRFDVGCALVMACSASQTVRCRFSLVAPATR